MQCLRTFGSRYAVLATDCEHEPAPSEVAQAHSASVSLRGPRDTVQRGRMSSPPSETGRGAARSASDMSGFVPGGSGPAQSGDFPVTQKARSAGSTMTAHPSYRCTKRAPRWPCAGRPRPAAAPAGAAEPPPARRGRRTRAGLPGRTTSRSPAARSPPRARAPAPGCRCTPGPAGCGVRPRAGCRVDAVLRRRARCTGRTGARPVSA
jgi:hypothetical protein